MIVSPKPLSTGGSLTRLILETGGSGGSGGGFRRGGGGRGGGNNGGGGSQGEPGWGPLQLWARYTTLLDTDPLKTRMFTGLVISALGDILSQALDGVKAKDLDLKRLVVFSCWGGFGFTPMGFKWYNLIERTVPKGIPVRFLAKMAMDQTIFPPLMTTITFVCLTVLEGLVSGFGLSVSKGLYSTGAKIKDLGGLLTDAVDKVKTQLGPTLVENYKVWPLVQVLNFAVVPLRFQVLFVNFVAVWWNFVLSVSQHSHHPHGADKGGKGAQSKGRNSKDMSKKGKNAR